MNKLIFGGGMAALVLLTSCASKSMPEVSEVTSKRKKSGKAAEVNVQLGLAYLKQGNVQRAKQKLLQAYGQAPSSPDVSGALAYFFEKTGNEQQAQTYYQKALSLAPGKGPQLNNYGAFLCRNGKYAAATKYFDRANQDINYVNSAGATENAGLCALAIPNIAMAKKYFMQAIEQDPRRYKSYYELARMSIDKQDYKQAIAWVNQYQNNNTLRADLALLAYQAASKGGLQQQAKSFAWILEHRFPESLEYKKLLAKREHHDKRNSTIS